VLISPVGYREPKQIYRIVREKARLHDAIASIVEWQFLRMQEYRYNVIVQVARFFELLGIAARCVSSRPPRLGIITMPFIQTTSKRPPCSSSTWMPFHPSSNWADPPLNFRIGSKLTKCRNRSACFGTLFSAKY